MNDLKVWYELSCFEKEWTVWKFKEANYKEHGGYGSLGVFTSSNKQACLDYCEKNNIKLKKGGVKHDRIRI